MAASLSEESFQSITSGYPAPTQSSWNCWLLNLQEILPQAFEATSTQMSQKSQSFGACLLPDRLYRSIGEIALSLSLSQRSVLTCLASPIWWPACIKHPCSETKITRLIKLLWFKSQVQTLHRPRRGSGFQCQEIQFGSRQKLAVGLLTPV